MLFSKLNSPSYIQQMIRFIALSLLSLSHRPLYRFLAVLTDVLCILMALDLCNFQQYCIVLQWVKESSRRGDVTAKSAAEW